MKHAQGKGRRQPTGEVTIVAHSERGRLSMHEGRDDGNPEEDGVLLRLRGKGRR